MHKRNFGPDKKMVSEVGLGTWQIGGSWGTVEDKTAMEILRTATQAGITFFETADAYGDGRSERFIGKFLKDHPDKVFVATKLGRGSSPGWPQNFTPEAMIKHTENSLSVWDWNRLHLIQLIASPKKCCRWCCFFMS